MKKIYLWVMGIMISIQILNANNSAEDTLLETCGVLSAQGIYVTYSAIGSLADGYASGVYDDEIATQMLDEYILMSESVNEQLNLLIRAGILSSEDIGFVVELNNVYQLLIAEAQAFSDYIKTKDQSYVYVYESNRKKAWNKIASLLGFE